MYPPILPTASFRSSIACTRLSTHVLLLEGLDLSRVPLIGHPGGQFIVLRLVYLKRGVLVVVANHNVRSQRDGLLAASVRFARSCWGCR